MSLRRIIKDANNVLCGEKALLNKVCADSTSSKNQKYIFMIGLALFVQYVLPILLIFAVIPFFFGNIISLWGIGMISMINPIGIVLLVPLFLADLWIIVTCIIIGIILTIWYWFYYFRKTSFLFLVPIVMYVVGWLVSFIPYIGNALSFIISITPWMAIMVGFHYLTYSDRKVKFFNTELF